MRKNGDEGKNAKVVRTYSESIFEKSMVIHIKINFYTPNVNKGFHRKIGRKCRKFL
jgi:hypothetical protein